MSTEIEAVRWLGAASTIVTVTDHVEDQVEFRLHPDGDVMVRTLQRDGVLVSVEDLETVLNEWRKVAASTAKA